MDKIKALCVAHGEKMLAVFCAMFGLLALSSAQWVANSDNPEQVKIDAANKEKEIDSRANAWPEEQKLVFQEIDDVRDLTAVESMYKVDSGNFAITDFNPPEYKSREKRGMPKILVAENGVANYVIFPLAMPPEEDVEEDAEEEEKEEEKSSEEDEFQKLLNAKYGRKNAAAGGNVGGLGDYGSGYGGAGLSGMAGGMGRGPGGMGPGGMGPGGMGPGGMGPGYDPGGAGPGYGGGEGAYGGGEGAYGGGDLMGMYGSQMMVKEKRIRVSAGVSVRFVVDIQAQRAQMREALKLGNTVEEAQRYIHYTDIQVQRRQKTEDIDPWSSWQDLSSDDLGKILEDSLGIDRDVVMPAVTRNTITMPLPRRATGSWPATEVSHPRVEDFELDSEEQALIDKFNEMVEKKAEERAADMPTAVEDRGFAQFSRSASDMSMGMGMMGMGMGMGEFDYDDLGMGSGEGGKLTDSQKETLDKANATAENRLLLVRFMDFTVDRGRQYEYRVRLVLKNPNFNVGLDELEDPSLATTPELLSAWSDVSPKIRVPVAYQTYVEKVDSRPGRSESVTMEIYTDTTETGLPLLGAIKTTVGLPVAGVRLMKVVDLRKESLVAEDVVLSTDAVLADAESIGRISTSDHPELAGVLRRLDRGESLIKDQVTLIGEDGAQTLKTAGDDGRMLANHEQEQEYILDTYSVWDRDKAADGGGFFGPDGGEGDEGGYGGGPGLGMGMGSSASGSFFSGGGKKQSSRERARNRRKNGGMGSGMGGGMQGSGGDY